MTKKLCSQSCEKRPQVGIFLAEGFVEFDSCRGKKLKLNNDTRENQTLITVKECATIDP